MPCSRSASSIPNGRTASNTIPRKRRGCASPVPGTGAKRRLLVATHLPFPSLGRVSVEAQVFRWVPIIWDY
jgi:hypothetical protein